MLPKGFSFSLLKEEDKDGFLFCKEYLEEAWKEPVEKKLQTCVERTNRDFCLILKKINNPIGLIIYQPQTGLKVSEPKKHWLKGFYIVPEHRKTGLADLLLDESLRLLSGTGNIHIGVNFEKPRLKAWYEKRGWKECGATAFDVTGGHDVLYKEA